MSPHPYDDWISLYNDEIKTKWESEQGELRKVAMIYCAFENEINRLKAYMSNEIKEIKSELRRRDYLQKRQNFAGLAETLEYDINLETNSANKENEIPEEVPLKEINQNEQKTEDFVIESPDTLSFFEKSHSPPLIEVNPASTSPTLNKSSHRKRNSTTPSLILYPVITHKVDKTPKTSERKSNEIKAPKSCDDSNIMESSVIENTPELKQIKRTKPSKLSLLKTNNKKNKLSQSNQNSTLTQMFFQPKKRKKREINSDGSSMSINAMLELINQSSGSETDEGLDKSDDATVDDLDPAASNQKNEKNLNISMSFIENYDKIPEKKNKIPDFVYHDVVRGKERNKLKGWACAECENYYKGLNLSPDELQEKMNQCSRHRHRYQPRDETYKGFWDLSFGPTPKTQEKKTGFQL